MVTTLKVLFDLNVILDVLQKREPFYTDSARSLAMAETGMLTGYLAAHNMTTLFYLYTKAYSSDRARTAMTELLQFLSVAPVNQKTVEQALILPYTDFEDAVQMMATLQTGMDYIVTRNPDDYKEGPLPVVRPAELNALF